MARVRSRGGRRRSVSGPSGQNASHDANTGHQVARTFYVDGQELAAAMSVATLQPSVAPEHHAGGIRVVARLIKTGTKIGYFIPSRNADDLMQYCAKSARPKRGFEALIDCLELFVGPNGAYELRVVGWQPPEERAEQAKQEATNDVAELIRSHGLGLKLG